MAPRGEMVVVRRLTCGAAYGEVAEAPPNRVGVDGCCCCMPKGLPACAGDRCCCCAGEFPNGLAAPPWFRVGEAAPNGDACCCWGGHAEHYTLNTHASQHHAARHGGGNMERAAECIRSAGRLTPPPSKDGFTRRTGYAGVAVGMHACTCGEPHTLLLPPRSTSREMEIPFPLGPRSLWHQVGGGWPREGQDSAQKAAPARGPHKTEGRGITSPTARRSSMSRTKFPRGARRAAPVQQPLPPFSRHCAETSRGAPPRNKLESLFLDDEKIGTN